MELRRNHQFDPFSEEAANIPLLPEGLMESIDFNDPQSVIGKLFGGGPGTNLPIPKQVTPKQVRQDVGKRAPAVLKSFDCLYRILERHEATIQSRWTKKTKQQRLKILLHVWPDLPAVHRPDMEAWRKESPEQRQAGTQYRDAYIWPQLNQEDLTKPRTLLLLLNARGRNHPSRFAAADREEMHVGFVAQAVVPVFLNMHTVILNGVSDRKMDNGYGKLVSWEEHPDAFEWTITRWQFQPGEALLILEAQERLMAFLVDCCKLILHDIAADQLTSNVFPIQPEPVSKSENNVVGQTSLAVMAAERPYRLPADIDFSRVSSLLEAATLAKEDQLWTLREDPGQLAQWLLDHSDHRQEKVIDTLGRKHPTLHQRQEDVFWSRVIPRVIGEHYLDLESFSELSRQAQHVRALQVKYQSQIAPEDKLPAEFMGALLQFWYFLKQAAKRPMNALKLEVIGSPPFRPYFARTPPNDPSSSMMYIQQKDTKLGEVEGQLLWLLRTIWEDDRTLFMLRLPIVVDELQRLLDAEPKAREMITERVNDIIGDLAIICECLRQLENYHPWALAFEDAMVKAEKHLEQQYQTACQPIVHMINAMKACNQSLVAQLGKPTANRFDYPVWRRRNKENVEIMRRSEARLDALWSYIDKNMRQKAGDLAGSALQNLLTSRILQRTPEWADSKTSGERLVDEASTSKPLSEIYFELESRTSKTLADTATRVLKEQVKTRGIPSKSPSTNGTVPEANGFDPQPTFAVDARALKVFRTLFFVPSMTATPGEIPWTDFVHAMKSTGFGAEKLYGSVWHFTPTKLDVERSIQFHEPHPSGKIPFRIARRHGRRLYRAYGWHGAMFVLQEKTSLAPREEKMGDLDV